MGDRAARDPSVPDRPVSPSILPNSDKIPPILRLLAPSPPKAQKMPTKLWPKSCDRSGSRELGSTSWRFTAPCAPGDVMSPHVARFFPDAQLPPLHRPAVAFRRDGVLVGPSGSVDLATATPNHRRRQRRQRRKTTAKTSSDRRTVVYRPVSVREGDDGFLATPPLRGTAVTRMASIERSRGPIRLVMGLRACLGRLGGRRRRQAPELEERHVALVFPQEVQERLVIFRGHVEQL